MHLNWIPTSQFVPKPVTAVKYLMRRNMYENILLSSEHSLRDFEYIPFVKKNLHLVQWEVYFSRICLHLCLTIMLWITGYFMFHITTSSLKYNCKVTKVYSYEFNYCIVFAGQPISNSLRKSQFQLHIHHD